MLYKNTKTLIYNEKSNLKKLKQILKALPKELAIKYKIIIVKKKMNSLISYNIIIGKLPQLQILMKKEYFIFINAIDYTKSCLRL